MTSTKINGPINLLRLEGTINKIHKVIYLFMDVHLDPNEQTNCDDSKSINISDYFATNLSNVNNGITYDFFLETFPSEISVNYDQTIYSVLKDDELYYLQTVKKFFFNSIKVTNHKISSNLKNVRFHYIDIRDRIYVLTIHPLNFAIQQLKEVQHNPNNKELVEIIPIIIETCINTVIKFLKRMIKILNGSTVIPKKSIQYTETFDIGIENPNYSQFLLDPELQNTYTKYTEYLLNKAINNYHDKDIQKIIRKYIVYHVYKETSHVIFLMKKYLDYVKTLSDEKYLDNNTTNTIIDKLSEFTRIIFGIIARIIDIYFLRRFLDKDYIDHTIVYSGAAHSVMYTKILTELGFRITHAAKAIIDDISTINKVILEINNFPSEKSLFDMLNFLDINTFTQQCINVAGFPTDFL